MRTSSLAPARRRALHLTSALAVGAGLGLSACGGTSKPTPSAAVDSALSQLGHASSLSVHLSLGITPGQAQQVSKKGGGAPLTKAEADALTSGSVFFATQTGKGEALDSPQAVTDPNNAYDLGLQFGKQVPFEIRYVSRNLYIRADAAQLFSDIGQDPSKAAVLQKDLASLDKVVPGIADLGTSQWVEVDSASLQTLSGLLKAAASSSGGAQPDQAQIQGAMTQLRADALTALRANSADASLGTRGGRPEYAMTVNVHGFLAQFGPSLQKDLSALPFIGPRMSSGVAKLQDKVPATRTATADVYTSGGKLSEVDVDLNQFAGKKKMTFPVPARARFTAPPAISSPGGATVLNLSNLPGLLQRIVGGIGQHSSGANSSTSAGA